MTQARRECLHELVHGNAAKQRDAHGLEAIEVPLVWARTCGPDDLPGPIAARRAFDLDVQAALERAALRDGLVFHAVSVQTLSLLGPALGLSTLEILSDQRPSFRKRADHTPRSGDEEQALEVARPVD